MQDQGTASTSDRRRLIKTRNRGIFRRENPDGALGQYVVVYRAFDPEKGKLRQFKEYARTEAEAKAKQRASSTDVDRGEFQPQAKVTLRAFLLEWIDRYQGTGRRGFRENTRDEYRRLLDQYAHRFFKPGLRLSDVTPYALAQFVAWVANPEKQDGKRLSDSSIANVLVPVRAALSTAQREGLIRHNPSVGLALPVRERIQEDDDHEDIKALSRDQLAALLPMVPKRYRLFVLLIASTGLRISEAIGLQRKHLVLDGSKPHVRVRRAIVKGSIEPPKSKYGRRSVPLPAGLVFELRSHLADLPEEPDALVFASLAGTPLDPDNMRARILKPLMEEVGAPWAAWHTLRHTFASLQIARGVNIVALSRALGHHSAAFTLERYVHLLEGDEAPALDLSDELPTPIPEGVAA